MIKISNLHIEEDVDSVSLCAEITIANEKQKLYYKVAYENGVYLCTERADSFLIAILLFAMKHGEDISIEGTPISARLYYNLTNFLIPALASKTNYKKIKIISQLSSDRLKNAGFNGMGISCGIDSFYTMAENSSKNCPEQFKINCLTMFNMGSHGDTGGEKARKLFLQRSLYSQKFANEYGYRFLWVDSNISDFIKMTFSKTHTYRNISAVFAVRKAFENYYYSSGYSIGSFKIIEEDPAGYDTFLLSCLSDENIHFYSTGTVMERVEKTTMVSEFAPSYKYLNVCTSGEKNCGKCEKCIRTQLTLYAIGTIDRYGKVFNISAFQARKDKYIRYMLKQVYINNLSYTEIYRVFKVGRIKIGLFNRIVAFCFNEIMWFPILKRVIPKKFCKKK